MNFFRLCGDMLHFTSILLLLFKLQKSKSCIGISCRMQECYAIVFCLRYIDLFYSFLSIYNTVMKVFFIASTFYLIYLMRSKPPISQTYDKKADNFPYHLYLLPTSLILGILTTEEYSLPEIMWTTSIWLESVAIVPQLILLQQLREVENLTSDFVIAMGLYRAFYILNWIYRYVNEGSVNYIGWIGGVIQTALYMDFFYYYIISKWYGQKLVLPLST
eukprot:GHVL01018356.1.p1 GENE.GHVL01018356.1~~GHVL01018356.1.p1  ORF type:complete len:218 (+),score=-1.66 GHVL01018356.1:137-790(+)